MGTGVNSTGEMMGWNKTHISERSLQGAMEPIPASLWELLPGGFNSLALPACSVHWF